MNLLSAVNGLLHQCYGVFAGSGESGQGITGRAFYESVILRAIEDHAFRERLLQEPEAVLAEHEIVLPEQVKVTFVENTKDTIHIVIPPYVGD